MTRHALLIGNGAYKDGKITSLASPVPDSKHLAKILRSADIGGYAVETICDAPALNLRKAIEDFFRCRSPTDSAVLYISGHGFKDADGKLFFAAKDTEIDYLSSTAIPAQFVHEHASRSLAARKVIIIDSCYSGAFFKGMNLKSDGLKIGADDLGASEGRGIAIITASSSVQVAAEDTLNGSTQSVFTRYLTEGLLTGAADSHRTGSITLEDLFYYVREKIRGEKTGQEPVLFNHLNGAMVFAKSKFASTGVNDNHTFQRARDDSHDGLVPPKRKFTLGPWSIGGLTLVGLGIIGNVGSWLERQFPTAVRPVSPEMKEEIAIDSDGNTCENGKFRYLKISNNTDSKISRAYIKNNFEFNQIDVWGLSVLRGKSVQPGNSTIAQVDDCHCEISVKVVFEHGSEKILSIDACRTNVVSI